MFRASRFVNPRSLLVLSGVLVISGIVLLCRDSFEAISGRRTAIGPGAASSSGDRELTSWGTLSDTLRSSSFRKNAGKKNFDTWWEPKHSQVETMGKLSDSEWKKRKIVHYVVSENAPLFFKTWSSTKMSKCEESLYLYEHLFASFFDLVIDKNFIKGKKGGERIQNVINQSEDAEFMAYTPGAFQLHCQDKPPNYVFNKLHLNDYMQNTLFQTEKLAPVDKVVDDFTIIITRYEYANIYHTMTDFYSAFALMNFFRKTPSETHILIMDGHPMGQLDSIWYTMFRSVTRVSQLPTRTKYTTVVWAIVGYSTMLYIEHQVERVPLLDEFRRFVFDSYSLQTTPPLAPPVGGGGRCSRLGITLLWRRDYLAHPRNPQGSVSRKIANEAEIAAFIKQRYPEARVTDVQLDLYSVKQQLQIISRTDILVGMHGAGLTYALLMAEGSGLLELVPKYWSPSLTHFEKIAASRGIRYIRWYNEDSALELPNSMTTIPTKVIGEKVDHLKSQVCR